MIENTLFTFENIKSIIKDYYNFDIIKIKKINKGSGNIFLLFTKDDKYILKEFQSKYTFEQIEKEYKLILSLKDIPTFEYILTKNNLCYFLHKQKVCILIKYIEGINYKNNTLNLKKLKLVALLHGKLSNNLFELDQNKIDFNNFVSEEKIEKSKQFLIDFINKNHTTITENKIKKDFEKKLSIINSLDISKILKDLNEKIFCINCHGDFSVQQLIFNKQTISILDFASFRKIPLCWEIIRSYSYADKKCKNGRIKIDNLIKYIIAFKSNFALSKEDIVNMPLVYLLQLLCSNYGYKQYLENKEQNQLLKFGYFRTRLCVDLFENLEYYTSKLSKIE